MKKIIFFSFLNLLLKAIRAQFKKITAMNLCTSKSALEMKKYRCSWKQEKWHTALSNIYHIQYPINLSQSIIYTNISQKIKLTTKLHEGTLTRANAWYPAKKHLFLNISGCSWVVNPCTSRNLLYNFLCKGESLTVITKTVLGGRSFFTTFMSILWTKPFNSSYRIWDLWFIIFTSVNVELVCCPFSIGFWKLQIN